MRLLQQSSDGGFVLTDNSFDDHVPKYAILSHTWLSENEEVKFDDMMNGTAQRKKTSYDKIRFCGEQAAKDGLEYFWVDTCCINKSSSAELQEAITVMFDWYRKSARCYVHLRDVSVTKDERSDSGSAQPWEAAFRRSRWFNRGWTLQELLAPTSVEFYSVQGTYLGDKWSLEEWIHEITGISRWALRGESLSNFSVAERLAWARNRQTTRKEDVAYSLLGIFGIFMPLMYGEGDHAFLRLQENIDKKHRGDAKLDDLLETLPTAPQAAFNSRDNQHGATCLPDTRVELLQEIAEWIEGRDNRCIFWLNGMAGTGKSTVARTIARKYYDQGNLGGSFFFCRGGGEVSRAEKLCTMLASQLASKVPSLRSHICDAIARNKDIALSSLRDQWDQLIINPLSKLHGNSYPSAIVLVIDALDECDSERDIRIILRLLSTTRVLQNVRLRIFITSRPETAIQCGFAQVTDAEHQAFVLHDILPRLVDRDLTLFFEENFTAIRKERGWPIDWPGMRVVLRLVDISCGLFIWASTACRYIRDGKQLAMKRVSKLINGHRSGAGPQKQLDEIYITVLKDCIQQDYDEDEKEELYERLRVVIGSIILLFSPLSADALANFLQKDAIYTNETLADLHTIFNTPREKSRPIRLHHPTFRDFLLDKNRCRDLNFWVDEKERHKVLADNCIELMSTMLRRDVCGLQSPGTFVKDIDHNLIEQCIPPELQYACVYWVDHYRQAGTHLRDGDTVHRFLQEHFLHWLEALSLVGEISQTSALIRMYQAMLPPADNQKQIPYIKDCRRFMFAFHSLIEQAPLQIYCAGIVFIPPSNELRQHFWSEMHPWLKHIRIIQAIAPEAKDEYNYVNDLSFTPDGQQIASGSISEEVRVWYVPEKATRCKFGGQEDKVGTVAFSPDGAMLASGSDDATVMIWNVKTRAILHHLMGHTRWVNTVVFSPDSKLIASGSMDETLRIWDTRNGKELHILEDNSSYVNSIAFSPDGSLIASASADQIVRLWDVKKREIHSMLDGHSGPINSVRFSPNGKQIVSGSDDQTIKIWDTAKGIEIMTLKGHLKKVGAVTFSPDGRQVASGSDDKTVKLWQTNSGELLRTLEGHTSGLNAVTYAPDGQLIASCSFNDEVRLWDAKTAEARGKLADFEDPKLSSDEKLEQSLSFVAVTKGHSSKVICLVFSPDGETVASGSHDTTIKLWTRKGEERWTLEGHSDSVTHLTFSPTPDDHLLASASKDKVIRLWNAATGVLLHTLEGHSDSVYFVKFSSDGHLLASCSADKTIILWNTATGVALNRLKGHSDTVNGITFSPDDHLLASYSADMTVRLWDVTMGKEVSGPLVGHSDTVNSVVFSSDGKLLVSSSDDRTIQIWTTDGSAYGTLEGHALPVIDAAFSRDNSLVVSCSDDKTVRIWDLETESGQDILEVNAVVHAVAFSSCGRYIETDRGALDFVSFPSSSPSLASYRAVPIFVADDWLRKEKENILWLPADFHANTVAIWNETIVLGHSTGSVSFILF